MKVREFLLTRPCLQELDGYLAGLRWLVDNAPEHASHARVDGDVIGPLELYKADLMKGKIVPRPSNDLRDWEYAPKKPAKRKRKVLLAPEEGEVIE